MARSAQAALAALAALLAAQDAYVPALRRLQNRLAAGQSLPADADEPPALRAPLASYRAVQAALETARRDLADSVEQATPAWRGRLRELARREDIQRAVLWQNRAAYDNGLRWLLNQPPERNNQAVREKEQALARYIQRYCLKNDTIGFFGPIGWAEFDPAGPPLAFQAGPELISQRALYLENWAVAAVAASLERGRDLRPWLAPYRLPTCAVDGRGAYFPLAAQLARQGFPAAQPRIALSPAQLAVLALCDGERTPGDIAAARGTDERQQSAAEVMTILGKLQALQVIGWSLRIAPGLHPERELRRRLEKIEDPALRADCLAPLERLEAAVAGVRAAGAADELRAALATLDDTFTAVTGQAPARAAGQTYAGRTLVYEDCVRAGRLTIGPGLLATLAGPLELLLLSARWFTAEIAAGYRAAFEEIYEQLAAAQGGDRIDLFGFAAKAMPLIRRASSPPIAAAAAAFQQRWAEALALPPGARVAAYRSAELRERIAGLFAAPHAGWPAARYLAPDVLVCAGDQTARAMQAGECRLVLGELHLYNTLAVSCLVAQSPPEARAELAAFLPRQSVLPVAPAEQTVQRTAPVSLSPADFACVAAATPSGWPAERTLLLAELEVVRADGMLEVRTRGGRVICDLIAFFEMFLVQQCPALPGLGAARHTPRVVIDDVVAWRETWRLDAADLAPLDEGGDGERMAAARRLMRRHGLPRHLFVRAPGEAKPLFLDFEAPLALRIIGKLARAAARQPDADSIFVCSEMLPAFDDLWLHDAAGRRYTSELRLVVADPQPYHPTQPIA